MTERPVSDRFHGLIGECDQDSAILAEVNGLGARFALAGPRGLRMETITAITAAEATTFTAALQSFAATRGIALLGCVLAISAAGTIGVDAVRITNGRWFISRSGLQAILGRPPLIMNDVSAMAWSLADLPPAALTSIDRISPKNDTSDERNVLVWVGDGVGAAVLQRRGGRVVLVIDGEAGHSTFAPDTPEERLITEHLRRIHGHCSVERILTLIGDRLAAAISGCEISDLDRIKAAVLGAFCGDLAMIYGAWGGVYVAGPSAAEIVARNCIELRARFEAKGRMKGMLAKVPLWHVSDPNLALRGAAAAFATSMRDRVAS